MSKGMDHATRAGEEAANRAQKRRTLKDLARVIPSIRERQDVEEWKKSIRTYQDLEEGLPEAEHQEIDLPICETLEKPSRKSLIVLLRKATGRVKRPVSHAGAEKAEAGHIQVESSPLLARRELEADYQLTPAMAERLYPTDDQQSSHADPPKEGLVNYDESVHREVAYFHRTKVTFYRDNHGKYWKTLPGQKGGMLTRADARLI